MALYYQTEYRLGRHCGRISRSYTGMHAFLAIVLDLFLGSVFALVAMTIGLAVRLTLFALQIGVFVVRAHWHLLVAVMTMLVYCLTLPFALLHEAVDRRRSAEKSTDYRFSAGPAPKPEWAWSREI